MGYCPSTRRDVDWYVQRLISAIPIPRGTIDSSRVTLRRIGAACLRLCGRQRPDLLSEELAKRLWTAQSEGHWFVLNMDCLECFSFLICLKNEF